MTTEISKTKLNHMHRKAVQSQKLAHAPYSKYKVGAALMIKETILAGCNVENASFGATICAERNAICSAVACFGHKTVSKSAVGILVVTNEHPPAQPCALCLQVMAEFFSDEFPIYLATPKKIYSKLTLKDLLPKPFRHFKT